MFTCRANVRLGNNELLLLLSRIVRTFILATVCFVKAKSNITYTRLMGWADSLRVSVPHQVTRFATLLAQCVCPVNIYTF